jgi:signal transduction histidine kinase
MLSGLTIATLFISAKVLLSHQLVAAWRPLQVLREVGWLDSLSLLALALVVGLIVPLAQAYARYRIDARQSRPPVEALHDENAAVVRACRAVAREFAQPLTGALAYSEMLMADATYTSEAQRQEMEGLREGVLRMERLLQCLRDTVTDEAACRDDRSVADDVEHAIAVPLPRQVARR